MRMKITAEQIKNLGDLRLEYLKRFYDRSSVIQRYIKGKVVLHIHGTAGRTRCCVLSYVEPDDTKRPVLVWVREGLECSRPLATTQWLQFLDHCLMCDVDEFQHVRHSTFALSDTSIPILFSVFDRKLCALLDGSGVQECKFENEIIQSGSEVIYSLTNQNTELRRGNRREGWMFFEGRRELSGSLPVGIKNRSGRKFSK